MNPGTYDNQAASAYHSGPGVSKSNLDLIHNSPGLLEWSREAPKDEDCKAAVDIGTAFHCLLLEPGKFDALYVAEFDKGSNAIATVDDLKEALLQRGIEFKASASKAVLTKLLLTEDPSAPVTDTLYAEWTNGINGRHVLSHAEMKKLRLMRDSVMAHPAARKLIEAPGFVERSYYWIDETTGELCRSRHDKSVPKMGLTVDVKTTADIGKFARSVLEYRYHVQDAFYSDGHLALEGERLRGFPFVVVSTTRDRSRYPVRVFSLDQQSREIGRQEYRTDLNRYAECKRQETWPGIESISLPDWYLARAL